MQSESIKGRSINPAAYNGAIEFIPPISADEIAANFLSGLNYLMQEIALVTSFPVATFSIATNGAPRKAPILT